MAWDVPNLSPTQKIVLLSLADQANDDGVCWPSASKTSARTSLCERATRQAIADLENMGHLTRQIRPGRATYYTVHPCTKCTTALNAPLQQMHQPLHQMQDTPAGDAYITIKESTNNPINLSTSVPLHQMQGSVDKFSMHTDWLPDDEFGQQLLNSGIREPWIVYLDEFCLYWAGRPEEKNNHWGWQNKFLKNIMAKKARMEANLA